VQYCGVGSGKTIYYLAAKGTSRTRPRPAAFKAKGQNTSRLRPQNSVLDVSSRMRTVLENPILEFWTPI